MTESSMTESSTTESSTKEPSMTESNATQPRVLIVDDNPINLELVGDLLKLESFEVSMADSGAQSIVAAQQNLPDLILMDMRMPGMSGLEAQQSIRQNPATAHIPIVVLTASVMAGDKERLLAAGFDGFMQKPISVATFADEVRAFLPEKGPVHYPS